MELLQRCRGFATLTIMQSWLWLCTSVALSGDIYRAILDDGTVIFTDSPPHAGFEPFIIEDPPPKPLRVSVQRYPRLDDYDHLIRDAASRYDLQPALIKAIILAESAMNPKALSSAGAMGLMQLMPFTADDLGVTDPWDPAQNVDGGSRYIREQLDTFGDMRRAVAAYHAGPHNVQKYNGVPPFTSTQQYVERVLELYTWFHTQRPVR